MVLSWAICVWTGLLLESYMSIFGWYYKKCVLVSVMLTAMHLWSSLRQYDHCFPIHIHPGPFIDSPELSTHPVTRELDTPWMANPREKVSSVNHMKRKNQRFETITLLSFSQYFSPPEQRVQLQYEAPPKVIGIRHRLFSSGSPGTSSSQN